MPQALCADLPAADSLSILACLPARPFRRLGSIRVYATLEEPQGGLSAEAIAFTDGLGKGAPSALSPCVAQDLVEAVLDRARALGADAIVLVTDSSSSRRTPRANGSARPAPGRH